jgi:hypothetical protein
MDYVGSTDNKTGALNDAFKYTPETFNPVTMQNQDVSGFARDAYDSSRIRQQSANDLTRQRMQSSGGMSAGDLMALNQGGAKQRAKLQGKANMWGDIMQDRTDTDVANYNSQLGNMADIYNAEQMQSANIFNTGNTVLDAKNRWEYMQKMIEVEGKLKAGEAASELY